MAELYGVDKSGIAKEERAPQIFDDLWMMCQTERLETDTTGCEKTAKYMPLGAAPQTASHHPKTREKPGIPRNSGPSLWQGQKGSNPRHAVLESDSANFRQF